MKNILIIFLLLTSMCLADNYVWIHWNWPGDDGNVGTCHEIQLRYRLASSGPINNEFSWIAATPLYLSYPVPKIAGTEDSVYVGDLAEDSSYYFVARAWDEEANQSPLSSSPLINLSRSIHVPTQLIWK